MEIMGIGSVAAITVICYLIGRTVKNTKLDNKWIPSIVGGVGLLLGLAGWRVIPDYPASDWLTALAVGTVSGLAATGIDQLSRQLKRIEVHIPAYDHFDANGDPVSEERWREEERLAAEECTWAVDTEPPNKSGLSESKEDGEGNG